MSMIDNFRETFMEKQRLNKIFMEEDEFAKWTDKANRIHSKEREA